MANLGTFTINTDGEYEKVSELTEITFIVGDEYLIQGNFNLNIDKASKYYGYMLRVGTEGDGFHVDNQIFSYTADADDLYIKNYGNLKLNIHKNS